MLNGYCYTQKVLLGVDTTGAFDEQMMGDEEYKYSDSNQLPSSDAGQKRYQVSGNSKRDLWKNIAFSICESNGLSKYERASLGALCGHRQAMLDVATSWEDRVCLEVLLQAVVFGC
jgi:hypothetical protein